MQDLCLDYQVPACKAFSHLYLKQSLEEITSAHIIKVVVGTAIGNIFFGE